MAPTLPNIINKKQRTGEHNNASGTSRIALASMAIEVYNQSKTGSSSSALLNKINDRDIRKQVIELVRSIPSNFGIDSINERNGTLDVSRHIYRALALEFTKFTLEELRNVMILIIQKNVKKNVGCNMIGVSESTLDSYFGTIIAGCGDDSIKSIRNLQNEFINGNHERKLFIINCINSFERPNIGRPTLLPPAHEDMFAIHQAGQADFGRGVSKSMKQANFRNHVQGIGKSLLDGAQIEDDDDDDMIKDKKLKSKKGNELVNAKIPRSYMAQMQNRVESRLDAKEVSKKASGVSQKRAVAANPLLQHRWVVNVVLPHYKKLRDEGILQTDQPPPKNIHNYDEVGSDDDGKINRVSTLYFTNNDLNRSTDRQIQIKSAERASFHNSLLVGNNATGDLDTEAEPFIIKQSADTELRGDLTWKLDKYEASGLEIGIGHSPSGYSTQDIFDRMIRRLVLKCKCSVTDPHFAFFDAHDSHMGPDTLQFCLDRGMHVFFFPSNNSINDQPEDNGPNGMLQAIINRKLQDWNVVHSAICMNQVFMNEVLVDALYEFTHHPKRVQCVINAFASCNLSPMIPFFKPDYSGISDELQANPKLLKRLKDRVLLSSPFITDPEELKILALITNANIASVSAPLPSIKLSNLVYQNGLAMNTTATTINQTTGEVYTIMLSETAREQLGKSHIIPTQQVLKDLKEQKQLKKVKLSKKELGDGINDGDDDNDGGGGLTIDNVRSTKFGCLVNAKMIGLLSEKSKLKEAQELKTKTNKENKVIKADGAKKAGRILKDAAIKFFKLNIIEKDRKLWIKIKLQPEIHSSIKAFGASVIDPNGNGKTVLKVDALKTKLYSLITEAIENGEDDDVPLDPETSEDDEDDDANPETKEGDDDSI